MQEINSKPGQQKHYSVPDRHYSIAYRHLSTIIRVNRR